MIRINLLPQASKRTARSAPAGNAQVWAAVYFFGALVFMGVLAAVYFSYESELEEQRRANNQLQASIDQLRERSARLEEVRAQLEASLQLEDVVGELNRARTGPTRALMEVSRILSMGPGSGPTIDPAVLEEMRRTNPLAGYNRSWDTRRLWIESFIEDNRNCSIKGLGRTNEDVAEFLRRLSLSELFTRVTLQRTEAKTDTDSNLPVISFELTCQVAY
ncbi:MAG: PilN domain-containing protein [Myxococcales bacterium]|nr:PilN domain-containing protein [Myxococcales bacterium]